MQRNSQGGAPPRREGWSRRGFLESIGAAALVPIIPSLSGCGDDNAPGGKASIAIIGGGIAGLTAAHFLSLAGVRAEIYEAAKRVGGRMFTARGMLAGDQLVELGGELVDSNHLVIPALARTFGLDLDDLVLATDGLQQDRFVIGNALLSETAIVDAFMPVAAKMQLAIAAGEGTDPASAAEFERIDAMSIREWLETEAGLPASSQIRQLLEVAYLEEYGLEVTEQSAWNMLYLIDSATPDPFRIFGDSDERFHFHRGNDALPTAIAEHIEDQIHLEHRLTRVVAANGGYDLTFGTPSGEQSVHVDHVVYALPFSRLRHVDLESSGLSIDKLAMIDQLGYGTNAKLMMQFSDRHWESAPLASAGGVITDTGELQTVWATSRGQEGEQGILTNFVGGRRGLGIGDETPEHQAGLVLPWIDAVLPGTAAKYVPGSAIRMHWPSYEHTQGSYACYKVGQWAFFGTEGTREDNQHFCGEHCSEDFQGYMEGGAETGAMVAAEILDDLEIAHPQVLAGVLSAVAGRRPRASYHAGFGRRMRLGQIRKRAL